MSSVIPTSWTQTSSYPRVGHQYVFVCDAARQLFGLLYGDVDPAKVTPEMIRHVSQTIGDWCRDGLVRFWLLRKGDTEFRLGKPADWINGDDLHRVEAGRLPRLRYAGANTHDDYDIFLSRSSLEPHLSAYRRLTGQLDQSKPAPAKRWAAHSLPSYPVSSQGVAFQQAFATIGTAAYGDAWTGGEVRHADFPVFEAIPPHEELFDGDQLNEVRRLRHFGTAQALYMLWHEMMEDAHLPAYSPQVAQKLERERGALAEGDLTAEAWNIAHRLGATLARQRQAAVIALREVSEHVCTLAEAGDLKAFYRPIGGGPTVPMPAEHWAVDDVAARCARAGYDPDRPYDVSAEATVNIFFDAEALDAAADMVRDVLSNCDQDDEVGAPGHEAAPADVGSLQELVRSCVADGLTWTARLRSSIQKANPQPEAWQKTGRLERRTAAKPADFRHSAG
jgi:hypothetical protein